MATKSLGKKFEDRFRLDWQESVPDSFNYRLMDVTAGYQMISNVQDFISYKFPIMFCIDCKTHKDNTLNFSDFSQYDEMVKYAGIKGVHLGTVIWFYDHDKVVWVPIETWMKIKEEGKKSFNVKMVEDQNYETLLLPSTKLRTFLKTDYLPLVNYYGGAHASN